MKCVFAALLLIAAPLEAANRTTIITQGANPPIIVREYGAPRREVAPIYIPEPFPIRDVSKPISAPRKPGTFNPYRSSQSR